MRLAQKLLICFCKELEAQWSELDEKYVNVIIRRMLLLDDKLKIISFVQYSCFVLNYLYIAL